MKRLISILCVLMLLVGICAVGTLSAGAEVEAAQTVVNVKSGDSVTYILTLGGIKEKVIGSDFSVYYDDEIFDLVSVADFNDQTDPSEWTPLINTELYGEVKGNFSLYPKGVDFSTDRHFITVNLKAVSDGSAHISYFLRYLYDNHIFDSTDKPQITEYKLTCDVLVNGNPVVEDAQPELNVETPQKHGNFVNSVTGDSKDADPSIPGTVAKPVTNTNTNSGTNTGTSSGTDTGSNSTGSGTGTGTGAQTATTPASTSVGVNVTVPLETNAQGEIVSVDIVKADSDSTSDEALAATRDTAENEQGGSPALWIVICVLILIIAGVAVYFVVKSVSSKKEKN